MSAWNRRLAALLPILLLIGCGPGWKRTEPATGTRLPPRDQFLVHHGDSTDRWHALEVTGDSVSGVHWLTPIDCDSCRTALPRASVDSIQLGHPVRGLFKGYALVVYGPMVALGVLCLLQGQNPACWIPPST